ncbi:hypothetical protein N7448_004473 [Penicillium atrosanguineum]|nr:hypothetical protein N7448_004473 [Penicillium atrosanguineum]
MVTLGGADDQARIRYESSNGTRHRSGGPYRRGQQWRVTFDDFHGLVEVVDRDSETGPSSSDASKYPGEISGGNSAM